MAPPLPTARALHTRALVGWLQQPTEVLCGDAVLALSQGYFGSQHSCSFPSIVGVSLASGRSSGQAAARQPPRARDGARGAQPLAALRLMRVLGRLLARWRAGARRQLLNLQRRSTSKKALYVAAVVTHLLTLTRCTFLGLRLRRSAQLLVTLFMLSGCFVAPPLRIKLVETGMLTAASVSSAWSVRSCGSDVKRD